MNFLQFAVWGAYLTCIGNYLGPAGMGDLIPWFYSIQGIVSIFMPAIMGIIADKYVQPQRLLGICHVLAGLFMLACWYAGWQADAAGVYPDRTVMLTCYTLSVAFYMPTLALSNTVAFSVLNRNGYDTVTDFPPIRVLGTVGFIASMWFVNCAAWSDGAFSFSITDAGRFQYTYMQLFVSGVLGLLLAAYCFTLPECPRGGKSTGRRSLSKALGLNAFRLFKQKKMALFFIFSMLLGICLQITNGFASPFIFSFGALPEYADTFGVQHANILISISQISETCCILLIPFFLSRFGIKRVMFIAILAWVLRFAFFAIGNPGPGVWLFVLSMLVYGVAFDFFNISGSLFVNQETDMRIRSSAQGLFMMMTNGFGATVGTLSAQAVINHFVYDLPSTATGQEIVDGWNTCWLIFAGYALVVAILFSIFFKYKHVVKE